MSWCEKSRQLQNSLKLIQAELSRKTFNYFLEPVDLFSVPRAIGSVQMNYQKMLMNGSSGNGPQQWGSVFFIFGFASGFYCKPTNWFATSLLDIEESTFYICKETQNHLLLPPMENKLSFFVISDRPAFTYNGSLTMAQFLPKQLLLLMGQSLRNYSRNLADFNQSFQIQFYELGQSFPDNTTCCT